MDNIKTLVVWWKWILYVPPYLFLLQQHIELSNLWRFFVLGGGAHDKHNSTPIIKTKLTSKVRKGSQLLNEHIYAFVEGPVNFSPIFNAQFSSFVQQGQLCLLIW